MMFYECIDLEVVFQALFALNLSFLTKVDLAVAKWLRLYIELPDGTAMSFTDRKTERFRALIARSEIQNSPGN